MTPPGSAPEVERLTMHTVGCGDNFDEVASSDLHGWHLRRWKSYQVGKEASDYRRVTYD